MTAAGTTAGRRWACRLLALAVLALPACTSDSASADDYMIDGCERADLDGRSVARVWDEALLDAIRRDVPAPTVHARNLFHTSAAMWDAWAAYDPEADGYFVDEKHEADDVRAAREAAISYAAYRVLLHRYSFAAGLQATFDELVATMESLCYRIDFAEHRGRLARGARQPHRRGRDRRRARRRLAGGAPLRRHRLPAGEPAAGRGRAGRPDGRPEPVAAARAGADRGAERPADPRATSSASSGRTGGTSRRSPCPASADGLPVDPGPPPRLGDDPASAAAFKQAAVDVIRASSELDPDDGVDDRHRPGRRPATTRSAPTTATGTTSTRRPASPTRPTSCARGDFARVLAEFWADGPESETPPGHWNTIANDVSDTPGPRAAHRRRGCRGRPARVGRQAVLRPQRRGARRRRGGLGGEGPLRLGPADLDDPLHGRARAVERSGRARLPPRRAPARPRAGRGGHRGVERARAAPRAPRRPRRRGRRPGVAGQPRGSRAAGQRRGVDPRRRLGAVPARRRS